MVKKGQRTGFNFNAVVILLLVVAGVVGLVYFLNGDSSKSTISSIGNAEISVLPDKAVVGLVVETKNISAQAAKDANALISGRVLSALSGIGIKSEDIETENYNIYPEYDWSDNRQRLIGYVASNYIIVNSIDFNNLGKIVDSAINAGALVSYINFDLSSEKNNEYKAQVLASASLDAKNKAEAIATGLGKRLGNLVSVTTSDYNYVPYPLYAADAAESVSLKQATTNISPRKIDIRGTVSVVYNIK